MLSLKSSHFTLQSPLFAIIFFRVFFAMRYPPLPYFGKNFFYSIPYCNQRDICQLLWGCFLFTTVVWLPTICDILSPSIGDIDFLNYYQVSIKVPLSKSSYNKIPLKMHLIYIYMLSIIFSSFYWHFLEQNGTFNPLSTKN